MRAILASILLVSALAACGDDPPKPVRKAGPAAPAAPGGGGQGGPPGSPTSGAQLVLRPKVQDRFRKEFTKDDFTPDVAGDKNRDPFTSYVVQPAASAGTTQGSAAVQPTQDECQNRMVAEKYGYGDLKLIGIVMRGTKNFAMFKDPLQVGQIAYQGYCLGKDKARIIEITPSCVRLEIRGEAPPGAPAPPAHEEKSCLHPEGIEIE